MATIWLTTELRGKPCGRTAKYVQSDTVMTQMVSFASNNDIYFHITIGNLYRMSIQSRINQTSTFLVAEP